MQKNRPSIILRNEKGMVLVTSLLLVALLMGLGTTAVMQTATDMNITGNYKTSHQAFYEAEAGIHYSLVKIKEDLDTGAISLPTTAGTGNGTPLAYTTPSGFNFTTPSELVLTSAGSGRYMISATGTSDNGASNTIEVVITAEGGSAFNFGLFAEGDVDLKSEAGVYSYDSSVTPNPTSADSTGEGDVGSNTSVHAYNNTHIDGDVGLGADVSNNDAVYIENGTPGPDVSGTPGVLLGRLDPDPLGAVGGDLATYFANAVISNDNASAGLSGTTIDLTKSASLTLTGSPGGSTYYITDVNLNNGTTLNIDASAGPVNIYLTGAFDAKNGSTINVSGLPADFRIFSNSTSSIILKHGSAFKGLIYAPYAPVEIKNSADAYGICWANTIDIKNSGDFFFDTNLADQFSGSDYDIAIVSWKDDVAS